MFGTFSIMILIMSALLALIADIADPSYAMKGKRKAELLSALEKETYVFDENNQKELDENGKPKINWRGLFVNKDGSISPIFYIVVLFPFALLITLVVEPYYMITAIQKGIGNTLLAYAGLAIITSSVTYIVASYVIAKKAASKFIDPEEAAAAEARKYVELSGPPRVTLARRIVFALPDLYLVYLIVLALTAPR